MCVAHVNIMTSTRSFGTIVLTASLMLWVACQSTPKLIDYSIVQTPAGTSAARAAPVVIVGILGTDVPVAGAVRSHWNPQISYRLHRVTVAVENVLRGHLASRSINVYYFHFDVTYIGSPPLGSWRSGERRLMFIKRDAGVLRLACDGADYCTYLVQSGAHIGYKPDPHRPLDAALADILLVQGVGTNELVFADSIERSASKISRTYAVPKLEALALSDKSTIRRAACYTLTNDFQMNCKIK